MPASLSTPRFLKGDGQLLPGSLGCSRSFGGEQSSSDVLAVLSYLPLSNRAWEASPLTAKYVRYDSIKSDDDIKAFFLIWVKLIHELLPKSSYRK